MIFLTSHSDHLIQSYLLLTFSKCSGTQFQTIRINQTKSYLLGDCFQLSQNVVPDNSIAVADNSLKFDVFDLFNCPEKSYLLFTFCKCSGTSFQTIQLNPIYFVFFFNCPETLFQTIRFLLRTIRCNMICLNFRLSREAVLDRLFMFKSFCRNEQLTD